MVVEDRASLRRMLERALTDEGYRVTAIADGDTAVEHLRDGEGCDLVLTDLKLPGASGLEVLETARAVLPGVPVIVLTGYGTVPTAVDAMRSGAYHFLEKPVELDDLSRLVAEALALEVDEPDQGESGQPAEALALEDGPAIIGRHPTLRRAIELLRRVAATDSTVLLSGESGTGKELFARAMHRLSPRSDGPFVALNCAAIPEALVENELFGHEKGAFTGADRRQAGRFEVADGGTLFLDEIGELGLVVQGKVLRAIEERTFERVGGGRTLTADVRLVAATNRDLGAMVSDGAFRSDLYFRLAVFPIELPPLRERRSDIPLLARHLLRRIAERHGRPSLVPTAEALELLSEQSWDGNVRELANVLERAVILAEGPRLDADELETLLAPLDRAGERERVKGALDEAGGDRQRAAEILGVSRRTLLRRIRRHDLGGYPEYRR